MTIKQSVIIGALGVLDQSLVVPSASDESNLMVITTCLWVPSSFLGSNLKINIESLLQYVSGRVVWFLLNLFIWHALVYQKARG